jgi:hypothetical protein
MWLLSMLRCHRIRGGKIRTIVYCGLAEAAADFASQL